MEGWCGCHWRSANLFVRGSAGWVPRGMEMEHWNRISELIRETNIELILEIKSLNL